MRASARNGDVHLACMRRESVARRAELGEQCFVAFVNARVDLDHALRELRLQLAGVPVARSAAQQIVRIRRQVEVARIDQLQLELDADRQSLRTLELERRQATRWGAKALPMKRTRTSAGPFHAIGPNCSGRSVATVRTTRTTKTRRATWPKRISISRWFGSKFRAATPNTSSASRTDRCPI